MHIIGCLHFEAGSPEEYTEILIRNNFFFFFHKKNKKKTNTHVSPVKDSRKELFSQSSSYTHLIEYLAIPLKRIRGKFSHPCARQFEGKPSFPRCLSSDPSAQETPRFHPCQLHPDTSPQAAPKLRPSYSTGRLRETSTIAKGVRVYREMSLEVLAVSEGASSHF